MRRERRASATLFLALCATLALSGCVPASAERPSPKTSSATPAPSPTPQLSTFRTDHAFGDFLYHDGKLIFSGADWVPYPLFLGNLYERNVATGVERLLVSARGERADIVAFAKSDDWLLFEEMYREGPVVYRLRAVGEGSDVTLTECVLSSADDQQQQRRQLLPMLALDGSVAVWTQAPGPCTGTRYQLMVMDLSTGQRAQRYAGDRTLTFPSASGGEVVVGEGAQAEQRLLRLRPFESSAPVPVAADTDLSEPSLHDGLLVAKKGGDHTLDPAGVVTVDLASGRVTSILARDELAWSPTFDERFIAWQGGRTHQSSVWLFDRASGSLRDIYEILGLPAPPIASRPAAFPGALVWLSVTPEDMKNISTAVPQFNVLRWH